MRPRSKREQFYEEVGEAMAMNNMRSFINLETLDVGVYPDEHDAELLEEDAYEEIKQDHLLHPGKFLQIESLTPAESFRMMENFTETVKDKPTRSKLTQALEGKKPFANFKWVIDNSPVREAWFDFRNKTYAGMAKEWIEGNAPDGLKEKIKQLPAVFIA